MSIAEWITGIAQWDDSQWFVEDDDATEAALETGPPEVGIMEDE